MYTLPAKTSIRIRQPGKQLVALIATVFPGFDASGRITVELTDWVQRDRSPVYHRRIYRWYDLATGESMPIFDSLRPFELEPGFALLMYASGDVTIFVHAFSDEPDAIVAMDVARDAILEGRRDPEATRILREAIPHGWPLFLALIRREKNLLATR